MPLYPSSARLREAVARMQSSRAKPVFADYLIGTRGLHLGSKASPPESELRLSQSDETLVQAMDEVLAIKSQGFGGNWAGPPFLFIFDDKRPFRHVKHRSNGTADTVAGWQRSEEPPLKITGERPKGEA